MPKLRYEAAKESNENSYGQKVFRGGRDQPREGDKDHKVPTRLLENLANGSYFFVNGLKEWK